MRVRATSTTASSCVLEGYNGSSWSSYWPSGMPTGCPVTFSSPTEGTVDLYLPSGSRRIYRGQLTATHRGSSSLATVNRLPMQHYLRSVVSIEMSPYFHQQALRAQSVAARTYAQRGVNGTGYYDTCDTTSCQPTADGVPARATAASPAMSMPRTRPPWMRRTARY